MYSYIISSLIVAKKTLLCFLPFQRDAYILSHFPKFNCCKIHLSILFIYFCSFQGGVLYISPSLIAARMSSFYRSFLFLAVLRRYVFSHIYHTPILVCFMFLCLLCFYYFNLLLNACTNSSLKCKRIIS